MANRSTVYGPQEYKDGFGGSGHIPEQRGWPRLSAKRARESNEEDRLGMSPMAMLRLRWSIEEDVPSEPADPKKVVIDVRDRLKAVER